MTSKQPVTSRRWLARLAVAVAALSLPLAACSGAEEATEAGSTAATGTTPGGEDAEQEVELGEARSRGEQVREGRFAVTVGELDCEAGGTVAEVEATGRFCLLAVDVTNATDTEQSMELDRQVLLDETGTEYAISHEATEATGDLVETVQAGESVTMTLVYDIPEDARIVAARISDDEATDGVLVDLQG